jgi:large subunit ribosomal protein L28
MDEEKVTMAQVCDICSKGPIKARKITRRGKSKKSGGIGLNITGIALRRQMPNLQSIRAIVNGKPQRVLVCTRCLRTGKVQKRLAVPKTKAPAAAPAETTPVTA